MSLCLLGLISWFSPPHFSQGTPLPHSHPPSASRLRRWRRPASYAKCDAGHMPGAGVPHSRKRGPEDRHGTQAPAQAISLEARPGVRVSLVFIFLIAFPALTAPSAPPGAVRRVYTHRRSPPRALRQLSVHIPTLPSEQSRQSSASPHRDYGGPRARLLRSPGGAVEPSGNWENLELSPWWCLPSQRLGWISHVIVDKTHSPNARWPHAHQGPSGGHTETPAYHQHSCGRKRDQGASPRPGREGTWVEGGGGGM